MQRKVDFYIAEDSKTNVTVAEMEVAEMDIIESPVCPLFIEIASKFLCNFRFLPKIS